MHGFNVGMFTRVAARGGELPDIFGRDVEPDLDNFHHIHLAIHAKKQAKCRAAAIQYNRTTEINEPNNDYWLIYFFDGLHDEYLLLTIIGPDAHNCTDWNCFLRTINHEIVISWINGSVIAPFSLICSVCCWAVGWQQKQAWTTGRRPTPFFSSLANIYQLKLTALFYPHSVSSPSRHFISSSSCFSIGYSKE